MGASAPVFPSGVTMHKIRIHLLAALIAWSSIVMPGRAVAQSQVMAAAVGVISSISTAGVVTRGAALLGGPVGSIAALAVGATIAGFYWTGSDGQTINLIPKSKATELTANVATAGTPVAPGYTVDGTYGSSPQAACSASVGHWGNSSTVVCSGAAPYVSGNNCNQQMKAVGSTTCGGIWSVPVVAGCPTGRTLMPDGMCYTSASSGSQPGQLPQTEGYKSPDVIGGQAVLRDMSTAKPTSIVQDKAVSVSGDANRTVQVTPTADGGIKVTTRTYDPSAQTTKIETVQVDPVGKVVSNTSTEVNGNVIAGSTGFSFDFPTDYNREATQSSILDQTTQALTEARTDRESAEAQANTDRAGVTATLSSIPDAGRWTTNGLGMPDKGDFQAPNTGGLADALPGNDGSCVKLDLAFLGNTLSLDPCPVVGVMRPLIDWSFMLGAVIATWFFILGRREET